MKPLTKTILIACILLLAGLALIASPVLAQTPTSITWTQGTNAPFTPRSFGTSAVSPDNSLSCIGGYDGLNQNDVWRLYGGTYTLVTPSAAFTTRRSAAAIYNPISGKIFEVAGYDGPPGGVDPAHFQSDVWSTTPSNTAAWMQVTGNAGFPGTHGEALAVNTSGYMFKIGGDNDQAATSDIWMSTPDGMTWTDILPNSALGYRGNVAVASVGDIIYAFGGWGEQNPTVYHSDLWAFDTRTHVLTCLIPDSASPIPGKYAAYMVADTSGNLYIMAGTNDQVFFNDVWTTPTPTINLTKLPNALWSGRKGSFVGIDSTDKIIIVAGSGDGGFNNETWYGTINYQGSPTPTATSTPASTTIITTMPTATPTPTQTTTAPTATPASTPTPPNGQNTLYHVVWIYDISGSQITNVTYTAVPG